MTKRKTFREKLAEEIPDLPRVEPISGRMRKQWGEGTIVISTAREVDEIMRQVRKGKLITINQIRETVALRHGATIGCPMTTGIFARIAAGAAGEEEATGKKRVTPYWRTLKSGGELNAKYAGGLDEQKKRLESEGHTVIAKGSRFFVRDHERVLARIE